MPMGLMGQTEGMETTDTIAGKEFKEVVVAIENIVHKGTHDEVMITPAMRKNAKNISQVIGKIPGFRYDPVSKVLHYMGDNNIKILVDSIDKNLDQVKQLGHQRFSRVDVIYNPTGKYQGYDILLNLHTKTYYEGYDMYAEESGAIMPSGRNGDGKDFSDWGNQLLFNYTREKWTFGLNDNYNWVRRGVSNYSLTSYPLNQLYETALTQPSGDPTNTSVR